jgi:hypothetical protein
MKKAMITNSNSVYYTMIIDIISLKKRSARDENKVDLYEARLPNGQTCFFAEDEIEEVHFSYEELEEKFFRAEKDIVQLEGHLAILLKSFRAISESTIDTIRSLGQDIKIDELSREI